MKLYRALTLDRLVTAIVFIAIFTMAVRVPIDTDTWWHLQTGRWIVENQAPPTIDTFSHTRFGESWINASWLTQLVFYLLFNNLSYAGLALLIAGLVTVAFAFAWQQCREANLWLRAFIVILGVATSGVIWAARPQMFSLAFAAIAAYLLYRYKAGDSKAIWWLPPLMLVWVNTHGGFAVGFILMVAYLFGETFNQVLKNNGMNWQQIRGLAVVMGICLLVALLNPNGIIMWGYPFRTVGIGVLRDFIAEWRPPDFHQMHLHPFIWMVLGTFTALGLSGRRADFTDLTLIAVFSYMSLLATRNIALFALMTTPVLVKHSHWAWEAWRERTGRPPRIRRVSQNRWLLALNWALLILLLLVAGIRISQPISAAANEQAQADTVPVEAVEFLRRERPAGPMLNSYNWGGYLIWQLPEYPVFVDGRTDLYDDQFLTEYLSIVFAQDGWEQKLDHYGIKLVLIEPQSMLGRMLAERPGWEQIYQDETAIIFAQSR